MAAALPSWHRSVLQGPSRCFQPICRPNFCSWKRHSFTSSFFLFGGRIIFASPGEYNKNSVVLLFIRSFLLGTFWALWSNFRLVGHISPHLLLPHGGKFKCLDKSSLPFILSIISITNPCGFVEWPEYLIYFRFFYFQIDKKRRIISSSATPNVCIPMHAILLAESCRQILKLNNPLTDVPRSNLS